MGTGAAVAALGRIDLGNIRRDRLLVWMTLFPPVLALGVRWGIPALTEVLSRRYGFDLSPYNPLILSFIALTTPGFVGAIFGFLLLDQRDDDTLTALRVTPLTLRGYLVYRTAVPMLWGGLVTFASLPLTGLVTAGPAALVCWALVCAPMAPLAALFFASFAANKVQGFALMKASGVIAWPAMIAWFIPMPWQLAMGISPHYWFVKTVWITEQGSGGAWPFATIALLYQSALLLLLLRRFERVMAR